jgi:hypothetical protein
MMTASKYVLVVLFGLTDGSVGMVDTVESYARHQDCAEAAMRYNDRNDPRYGTHVCIRDTDLAAFRASVQMARRF